MKPAAFALMILAMTACNNDKSSSALVKSTESREAKKTKSSAIIIPAVKYGIEGFYTGTFTPVNYGENKGDVFYNKITICIDSLNENTLFGHSIVAGNKRPFAGAFRKSNDNYSIIAKEPGDNKYDGVFEFTVSRSDNKLTGKWKSNDQKLKVTEREYELESRAYKYDPSLELPEDLLDEMLEGTYNEKTNKGEGVSKDVLKKNASTTLLTSADVENMYKGDLEVLRNSIYARHGYSFKNPRMRTLFDNTVEWYMPVATDVTALLTDVEKKNIELIKRYEKHATKYYDAFGR
jgi:hypothetical protein